jgi:hypothetical protein
MSEEALCDISKALREHITIIPAQRGARIGYLFNNETFITQPIIAWGVKACESDGKDDPNNFDDYSGQLDKYGLPAAITAFGAWVPEDSTNTYFRKPPFVIQLEKDGMWWTPRGSGHCVNQAEAERYLKDEFEEREMERLERKERQRTKLEEEAEAA